MVTMENNDEIRMRAYQVIKNAFGADYDNFSEESPLVGDNSKIDSMRLVELCLELEDISIEFGFEFDWTSENALSKSKSIFKNVATLIDHFMDQKVKVQ